MEKIRKVMIVGLGALGTLYADAFQKTEGCEVYVLVDEERKAAYEASGRVLNGAPCSFRYVLPEEAGDPMDLILVCTKSNGMHEALDMIEGYVGEETIIASLMNGVCFEELAAKKYGIGHVVYMIYLGDGVKNLNGEIEEAGRSNLFFGSLGNENDDEQVALLDDLCKRAGVSYAVMDDMLYAYWRKFLLIVSYNQTCALFGSDYSVYYKAPEAIELADNILREGIPLAKAAGVEKADFLFEDIRSAAMGLSQDCMPSITQDRLMGRQMEVDILSDEVRKRSRELGLESPYNDFVSLMLHTINKQNGYQ